ncbi:hypothetical protein AYO45_06305 [Gammaproteobacteria bacterium SCGC AG-212-F23]|nr:hypothetical protein AYO45_06305 [Gammaproteobacteria bacterium SCGC AG-212-F23]
MQNFLKKIVPFISLGILLVVFVIGIIFLSYLFIFGALLGLVLFGIAWLREKFFRRQHPKKIQRKGRTIDME